MTVERPAFIALQQGEIWWDGAWAVADLVAAQLRVMRKVVIGGIEVIDDETDVVPATG